MPHTGAKSRDLILFLEFGLGISRFVICFWDLLVIKLHRFPEPASICYGGRMIAFETQPLQQPAWIWPRAAYIHVPFCAHHCGYCDFAVVAGRDHLMDRYLAALETEISFLATPIPPGVRGSGEEATPLSLWERGGAEGAVPKPGVADTRPQKVDSIFIGGGTPTHLDPSRLRALLALTSRWLELSAGGEFSIEANPATLDANRVQALADHGVTRISLGAQSFNKAALLVLERDHGERQIKDATALIRKHGQDLSLDLIFGVPGQTPEQWRDDLRRALELAPDHISAYGLTYEKGTRLWKQRERGEVRPVGEDQEAQMYRDANEILNAAGYEQYEISNYAKPGKRCRHNEVYWANEAYFGFGLGAASYIEGRRQTNTRDIELYLRRLLLEGRLPTRESEMLEPTERAKETLAIQLRRAQGVSRQRFLEQTGFELDRVMSPRAADYIRMELLNDDGFSVRFTVAGRLVSDSIIEGLL
jgi:oxygen-independent coproporphyrinogen-3 oxidase